MRRQTTFDDEDMDDGDFSDSDCSEKQSYNPGLPEEVNEVFSFQNQDDEDSDEDEQISTEFDLPDNRAWGKKKKAFYSADYVDTDLGLLTEKDEKEAENEEKEAKQIQKRIAEELDDIDFGLNVTASVDETESKTTTKHKIKIDMTKFTRRQKLELLEKESPELMVLIQDIKDQLIEVKKILGPLKSLKDDNLSNQPVFTFLQTKFQVVLHYCVNILFYLTLKSKRSFINPHPVIKRLAQYRQLLNSLDKVQGNVFHNLKKISELSEDRKSQIKFGNAALVTKNRNSERKAILKSDSSEKDIEGNNHEDEIQTTSVENMDTNDINESQERRLITYQISKNKGLTPHRSKEQRNPRVKHRNKYRKAKIRRKGAVREARKEIYRYAGEVSGIKVGLKKSVSLK